MTAVGVVVRDGALAPEAAPRGPRDVRLAKHDDDVPDALRVLGQPEPLDWYDIYKAWEIVSNAVGSTEEVVKRGWAADADIDRLTASANHPGISGENARHFRMKATPGSNLTMPINEADALIRRLVANWIESRPSY
jgi:hypothetical protein